MKSSTHGKFHQYVSLHKDYKSGNILERKCIPTVRKKLKEYRNVNGGPPITITSRGILIQPLYTQLLKE